MAEAVNRLTRSIQSQESIVIYGDYDVDGIIATAVPCWFFRDIGVPVPYYLPHRMREGYGLNAEAILRSLPIRAHASSSLSIAASLVTMRSNFGQTPGNGCDRHRSSSGAADASRCGGSAESASI